mmetsp:Transcript_3857/g.8196  ORF Transcript_3857/g.8196 Transcript_3857/m.8196 type:complete len:219 (-) Transcript_3857:2869-3525(-)
MIYQSDRPAGNIFRYWLPGGNFRLNTRRSSLLLLATHPRRCPAFGSNVSRPFVKLAPGVGRSAKILYMMVDMTAPDNSQIRSPLHLLGGEETIPGSKGIEAEPSRQQHRIKNDRGCIHFCFQFTSLCPRSCESKLSILFNRFGTSSDTRHFVNQNDTQAHRCKVSEKVPNAHRLTSSGNQVPGNMGSALASFKNQVTTLRQHALLIRGSTSEYRAATI